MKGRILTSLLTVIALTGLQAQNIPAVPRLVVGLTIDQLRTDYIEAFSALYGERGFKRLWREGRIYRNAEYDFINVDKSSAVAAIYSGTTPYTNGIVGDNWMDRSTLRVLNCVDDADFMGIYTSESTSPQKMKVSTLTDELVIATHSQSGEKATEQDNRTDLYFFSPSNSPSVPGWSLSSRWHKTIHIAPKDAPNEEEEYFSHSASKILQSLYATSSVNFHQ